MIEKQRANKAQIGIAVTGLLVQLVGIFLMASERVPVRRAVPLLVMGMFLAFAPIFMQLTYTKK